MLHNHKTPTIKYTLLVNSALLIFFMHFQSASFNEAATVSKSFIDSRRDTNSWHNYFANSSQKHRLGGPFKKTSTLNKDKTESANPVKLDSISRNKRNVVNIELETELTENCIKEIQAGNLDIAKHNLSQIIDDSKIQYIVNKVYNGTAENFPTLLKFAQVIDDSQKSFLVFKALQSEMSEINDKDISRLIQFDENLKSKIINVENIKSEIKSEASSILNRTRVTLEDASSDKFKEILSSSYSGSRVTDFVVQLCEHDFDLFCNSMKKAISRNRADRVLDMIQGQEKEYIAVYVGYYKVIFQGMSKSELNSDVSFKLAYRIKDLMNFENYTSIKPYLKTQLQEVKEKLQTSVKNVVFSSKVCIRNVRYNEYLYAGGTDDKYDEDRRYAFTWLEGTKYDPSMPSKFLWRLQRNNNSFGIISDQYNEYLFTNAPKWDDERRFVFTWVPGGNTSIPLDSEWIIEPDGQYAQIKSASEREYLFADFDRLHDSSKRHVFTFVPNRTTGDSKWEIVDCSKPQNA